MVRVIVTGYGIEIHKDGCQDIAKKGCGRGEKYSNADAAYDEYIDKDEPDNPGWLDCEIRVFPCAQ